MSRTPFSETADGLLLRVRLTPRGGRDRIDGVAEDGQGGQVLRARVAAPPVEGQANAALIRLIAKATGLPRGAVRLTAGETGRLKTLALDGDPAELRVRVSALL